MGKIETQVSAEGRVAAVGRSASGDSNSDCRIERSCISCNRLMGAGDVKVLLPRYVQERDPYVRHGAARRRFMCLSCYNRLRPSVGPKRAAARQVQAVC
jgi:hypothetical protein